MWMALDRSKRALCCYENKTVQMEMVRVHVCHSLSLSLSLSLSVSVMIYEALDVSGCDPGMGGTDLANLKVGLSPTEQCTYRCGIGKNGGCEVLDGLSASERNYSNKTSQANKEKQDFQQASGTPFISSFFLLASFLNIVFIPNYPFI